MKRNFHGFEILQAFKQTRPGKIHWYFANYVQKAEVKERNNVDHCQPETFVSVRRLIVNFEGERTIVGERVNDVWTSEGYLKLDRVGSYNEFQASWSGIHIQSLVCLDGECDEGVLKFFLEVEAS